jgi:MFS family permease
LIINAAASLTVPSALALLVGLFPEPRHQAVAIAAFGAWGAIGIGEWLTRPLLHNVVGVFTVKIPVLGLITGAFFVEYVSWSWVFWFVSTVIIPTTLISAVLIPSQTKNVVRKSGFTRFRSLDIIGILILTGK